MCYNDLDVVQQLTKMRKKLNLKLTDVTEVTVILWKNIFSNLKNNKRQSNFLPTNKSYNDTELNSFRSILKLHKSAKKHVGLVGFFAKLLCFYVR